MTQEEINLKYSQLKEQIKNLENEIQLLRDVCAHQKGCKGEMYQSPALICSDCGCFLNFWDWITDEERKKYF